MFRQSQSAGGTAGRGRNANGAQRRAPSSERRPCSWHLNALAGAKSAERAKASVAAYSLHVVTATGRPVLVSLGSAQMLLAAAEPSSLPFILGPFHTTLYYTAMLKMKRITK